MTVAAAATALAAERLSWEDCVQQAGKFNRSIQASEQQLQSSQYQSKAAYSGYLPQLSANLNFTRGNSYSFTGTDNVPISTGTGDKSVSTASLTLNQNIFAGFETESLVQQGLASRDYSGAVLDQTKVQASYELKIAFANLMYAQKYLALTREIIKRRGENAELVELHFEGGMENKGSLMLSKAFLSQANYDHVVARNAIDTSRQQLARAMGIDDSREIEIAGGIPLQEPGPEPDLKAIAGTTPVHRQSVAQERVNQAGVTLARSNFFPTLDLSATIAAQGNDAFPDASRRSFMLNMGVPLFSGGNDYYSLKSAAAQYAAAKYEREGTDLQLLPTLKQAYHAYTEAAAKLHVDQAFVEAAKVRAEIARSKYNNGLLSFEDWDIIENDLITKEKTLLASERERVVAEANWEQAQGRGEIR